MSQHYISCPTCGNVLAQNYAKYMIERDHIANDEKINPDDKKDQLAALLDKYNYKKRCCRMRIMGQNHNQIPNLSLD